MSFIYPWPSGSPQAGFCYCPWCAYHSQPKTIISTTTTMPSYHKPRHRKPGPAQ